VETADHLSASSNRSRDAKTDHARLIAPHQIGAEGNEAHKGQRSDRTHKSKPQAKGQ
jgi:hypothetical protein